MNFVSDNNNLLKWLTCPSTQMQTSETSKHFKSISNIFLRGHEVDFDLKRVFDMPSIEQMIFFYVNFDKCRKQIIRYEDKRATASMAKKHPKESKPEALDLLRCHSRNLTFEPVCLDSFNDARECLFKMDG